jgi:probable phosphoglycerate mutase
MADSEASVPNVFDEAFLTGIEGVTEVLFIRHAQQESTWNGVMNEAIDPPLTEQGRAQARILAESLSTTHLNGIFASPLKRAMETAQAVQRVHRHLHVEVSEDLREVELFREVPGDMTVADYLGRDLLQAVRQRMLTERNWDVYPYSEPSYDFKKRSINSIEAVIAKKAGERIAIVCHGGVINAYIGHIIGAPYDMFFRPAHASVSIVAVGQGRRVVRLLNDTHHLTTAEGDFATY